MLLKRLFVSSPLSEVIYGMCPCLLFCFFFSSRRRHTRFDCDWSSDVCSSDLENRYHAIIGARECVMVSPSDLVPALVAYDAEISLASSRGRRHMKLADLFVRSEERRVGKECRSRWSPYH